MKTSPTATRHRLDAILPVALELFAQQSYLDRKSLALDTKWQAVAVRLIADWQAKEAI